MAFVGKGYLAEVSANATEHGISSLELNQHCDCKESKVRVVCVAVEEAGSSPPRFYSA